MSLHHAECLPAFFSAFGTILLGPGKRIGEGAESNFEADPVLAQIAGRFLRVPHEAHGHTLLLLQNSSFIGGIREMFEVIEITKPHMFPSSGRNCKDALPCFLQKKQQMRVVVCYSPKE